MDLNEPASDAANPRSEQLNSTRQKRFQRSKACIACRTSKTRCIPLSDRDACKSCFKAGRPCGMPDMQKPRVKSAQKFSELEQKVDQLSKALALRDQSEGADSYNSIEHRDQLTGNHEHISIPASHDTISSRLENHSYVNSSTAQRFEAAFLHKVSEQTVTVLFDHWNTHVSPLFPAVATTFTGARDGIQKKPLLLLATIVAASSSLMPNLTPELARGLHEAVAQHIHFRGTQSLELVQTLILYSQYYVPPEGSNNFAFTHYMYIASIMSYDLGLDRRSKITSNYSAAERTEAARTWLAAYYTASISSCLLRRQQLVSDHRNVDLVIANFTESSLKTASDKQLYHLVRLQEIVEEARSIGIIAPGKEPIPESSILLNHQRNLHQRLDRWKQSATEDMEETLINHAHYSVRLYIYQAAIHKYVYQVFQCAETSNSTVMEPGGSISPARFEIIRICLESSHRILNAFIALDVLLIRRLPTTYLLWNVFAAICLTKAAPFEQHLSSLPSSEGESTAHSATRLLQKMVQKLEEICQSDYMPQARPFLNTFKILRSYYIRRQQICLNPQRTADPAKNIFSYVNRTREPVSQSSPQTSTDVSRNHEVHAWNTKSHQSVLAPFSDSRENAEHSQGQIHSRTKEPGDLSNQSGEGSSGGSAMQGDHTNDKPSPEAGDEISWDFWLSEDAMAQLDDFLLSQDNFYLSGILENTES